MSIKRLVIIFLILALAPVVLGKVALAPFSDFYQSWDMFKISSQKLIKDDYNYYKNLVSPWVERGVNAVKEKVRSILDKKIDQML